MLIWNLKDVTMSGEYLVDLLFCKEAIPRGDFHKKQFLSKKGENRDARYTKN